MRVYLFLLTSNSSMFEKGMWIFYSLKMASTSAQTLFSKRFASLICDGQTKTILLKGHQQRRNYAKYMDQPDSNDEFHVIPMGESDIGHGARVSFLSKDMERDKLLSILSVSDFGFRLADYSFLYGPIAIFPKTALSWRVLSPQHITPESLELFFLLQPKLDVLIIGAGDQKDVDIVRKQIGHTITQQRIGYEIMGTEEAVATFNFLNAEHRYTAAALFPPREMTCTPGEVNAIKNELRMAEPEDPESRVMGGLLGVLDSFSDDIGTGQVELRNACYRIWGTRSKEAIENYEKIVKLSEEKQRQRQERIEQKMEKIRMERYLESRKRSEELAALAEEKSKKSHLESGKKKEKDGEDVKG